MPREGHGSRNAEVDRKLYRQMVMPREGHGSRNLFLHRFPALFQSCPARGMGVEIGDVDYNAQRLARVMPREGHGSRNFPSDKKLGLTLVMPREGHGSRNW